MNTTMGKVQTWSSSDGPLALRAIHARHMPSKSQRVSRYSYLSGMQVSGKGRTSYCNVLSGGWVYPFSHRTAAAGGHHIGRKSTPHSGQFMPSQGSRTLTEPFGSLGLTFP
jgi:hypothetical protein